MPGCKEGHAFGGVKVGARHAHVGQALGVGISGSNGSKWSAATWLDNRCNFHIHCLRLNYETLLPLLPLYLSSSCVMFPEACSCRHGWFDNVRPS